ncbi:hypothetical protein AKJ38_03515 [candidate division MSBL1 archaeon SCGC-AAA259I14]|uniref:Uncharacterized protein n=1 Tax=candidate division MSBL1 archaeon SCGC-AAA259I14 TaxID=1698268 RepID=A0A133UQA1_9EURY|nr:hypothetical protein AKJ38_03515 [candidate division MSBL1 archaeon SCGC-AAA259I14]
MVPDVLRVEYKGQDYVIYDHYCCDPACRCNTAILNVFELKHSEDPSKEVFTIRVGLDGGYEIEERECEKSMVADFFGSEIRGNEKLFTFLRYRYDKMKNFGREVQKQRWRTAGDW